MFVSAMAQSLWPKVYCRRFQPHSARIGRTPLWRICAAQLAPCGSFGRRETKREKSKTRRRQGSWSHYTSGSRARHVHGLHSSAACSEREKTGGRLLVSCDGHFGRSSLHNDTKIRRIQISHVYSSVMSLYMPAPWPGYPKTPPNADGLHRQLVSLPCADNASNWNVNARRIARTV
jgi:hypothetical protein